MRVERLRDPHWAGRGGRISLTVAHLAHFRYNESKLMSHMQKLRSEECRKMHMPGDTHKR